MISNAVPISHNEPALWIDYFHGTDTIASTRQMVFKAPNQELNEHVSVSRSIAVHTPDQIGA